MYLLDTNHCSRIIEGDPEVIRHLQARSQAGVSTSVIARGELLFMAWKSERRETNLKRVASFLSAIRILGVDSAVADLYGEFKAAVIRHFGPRHKATRRKPRVEELGISDNDLWMAAIGLRHGMTIVSADSDFVRLKAVRSFPLESWWLPRGA